MSHSKKMVRLRRAQQKELPLPLQLEIGKRLSAIREAHDALARQLHHRIDAQHEVLRRYRRSVASSGGGVYVDNGSWGMAEGGFPQQTNRSFINSTLNAPSLQSRVANQYRNNTLEVVRRRLLAVVVQLLDAYVPVAYNADVETEYDVRQRCFRFLTRFYTSAASDPGSHIYQFTVTQETVENNTVTSDYYLHTFINNFVYDMHRDGWISEVQLREAMQEVGRA